MFIVKRVPVYSTASPRLTAHAAEPNQKWLKIVEDFCYSNPDLSSSHCCNRIERRNKITSQVC